MVLKLKKRDVSSSRSKVPDIQVQFQSEKVSKRKTAPLVERSAGRVIVRLSNPTVMDLLVRVGSMGYHTASLTKHEARLLEAGIHEIVKEME
jgi:hypothetical protein